VIKEITDINSSDDKNNTMEIIKMYNDGKMTIRINSKLKNEFSAMARLKGENMTIVVNRLIREYLNDENQDK
jgi:predicted HicB family RNase H-like nuclease